MSTRGEEPVRVVVIFERIGPYHYARLRAAGHRGQIIAMECVARDTTYDWDPIEGAEFFERVTLFREDEKCVRATLVRRLTTALRAVRPTVVAVPGWSHPVAIGALRWCTANRIPVVVMSDSTVFDYRRSKWKEEVKKRIVSLYSSGLVGGAPHVEYLKMLGMSPKRIFVGCDVVDNKHFAVGAERARRNEGELRQRLGLPRHYFLASARFVEQKNLARLLAAHARYRKEVGAAAWSLVILGAGPLASDMTQLTQQLGLEPYVVFPGFKQYDELPAYYGLAEAFVHVSTREPWGLVVNEAMAAGLPLIVSKQCGCARDLVIEGRNGFLCDAYDLESMAASMQQLSTRTGECKRMGRASRQIIGEWDLERFAAGLWSAVHVALGVGSVQTSFLDGAMLWALGRFG